MAETTRKPEKLTQGYKLILGIIVFLIIMAWLHGIFNRGPRGRKPAYLRVLPGYSLGA